MTASWRGDLEHFRWLRRSLERAGLAGIPHHLVAHTEDAELFRPLARDGMVLLPTAELLPKALEDGRLRAQRMTERLGRRLSKSCVSLNKRTGLCNWVRHAGWQMQQISKLAFAGQQQDGIVVVLDSDLLVTRGFNLQLFAPGGRAAIFEHWEDRPGPWHAGAYRLLRQTLESATRCNGYVGTPFVFHPPSVRALQSWLEQTHGRPWFDVLLDQPVSSWSEFCIYNLFVRSWGQSGELTYTDNPHSRDLYGEDLSGLSAEQAIRERFADPRVFFTNIPTARLARGRWAIGDFDAVLRNVLEAPA